ncbi:hypothetical protein QSV08_14095 [Maribacter sp. BPC-D8]|nr:hypothetical protein [Maribacter sp. BPC-D8]WRI28350.1 hypothetical protein QSV08_14095 [Maribacter sp. BPC-D8]
MKKLIQFFGAWYGAKKIGGGKCGCIGTFFVFLLLFWILGYVLDAF